MAQPQRLQIVLRPRRRCGLQRGLDARRLAGEQVKLGHKRGRG